jgi:hypothetical protein
MIPLIGLRVKPLQLVDRVGRAATAGAFTKPSQPIDFTTRKTLGWGGRTVQGIPRIGLDWRLVIRHQQAEGRSVQPSFPSNLKQTTTCVVQHLPKETFNNNRYSGCGLRGLMV